MEMKKYFLRSAKSESVQIPIQLQLSEDNDFLKNLLEVNFLGHAQQTSDQNSSGSELECRGLMNTLASDDTSTQVRTFDRLVKVSKITTSDTQSLINQAILQLLTAIGERLDKMEWKTVKKTSEPHISKGRSCLTKNTKVVRQSDSAHTSNHSAGMHANDTNVQILLRYPHLTI